MNIPSLAQMRIALAKQSNPDQLMDVGVNEMPDVFPKIYVQPDKGGVDNFPPPGGVRNRSPEMPIGGIDTDPKMPGQQLMPQSLMQPQQQQGQPEQPEQPQQPTGGAPQAPQAQQSNILSLIPQGQALSALKPVPQGMAKGGSAKEKPEQKESRLVFQAEGSGGVKAINVPRHMWEGTSGVYQKGARKGQQFRTLGMRDINAARAQVYGAENRDPLTIGQIGRIHKKTLDEHFSKPVDEQIVAENNALQRLRNAKHLAADANTLDESEKLDTVRHEYDKEGRSHVGYAAKGVAGHALYTSGHGDNQKFHVLNTCPGQTTGCGGGVDENGLVDTRKGTCFAPVAESQYPGASIRRASHEQAKHDPAMTNDWILAHTGSLRDAARRADKRNERLLFRPNVVDETDVSSRHAIKHLNRQRKAEDKPIIIANSYGKTNELHDPENGYFVTHSNVGPKTKKGASIAENIARDKQRQRSTIYAVTAGGDDFKNEEGEKTPPKNSYMVTDVKRGSPFDKKMQRTIKYAKYWSHGRHENELSEAEKAEGEEGHFGPNGKPTSPDRAHYGHMTLNGRRYDYQKQHILHPRLVQVGVNKDGTPHMIPTDSRFKDDDFLPKARFMTKNGKKAGAILMTTPTESTSNIGHQTSFTHHVNEDHLKHARKNNGEYQIDSPHEQEASMGKEYSTPKEIKFFADGGYVGNRIYDEHLKGFPEQCVATQFHNARRNLHEESEDSHHLNMHSYLAKKASGGSIRKPVFIHKNLDTMRLEMIMRK
jgi:hypothetical protein